MQKNPKERIIYLDLLRLLATLAVVFLHATVDEFFSPPFSLSQNWCIATTGNCLVRWCVPVFVMISGALFLNPNKEITYKDILKKRVLHLLLAYVIWTFIGALYGFIITDFDNSSILHLVRRLIVAPPVYLWFLPMLMGVYLLIPILRKIAQDNSLLRYALIIWIVFVFVSFSKFLSIISRIRHFSSLFDMNVVVGFTGYFLLGYFLSQHTCTKKQRMAVYILGFVGALVTIIGTFYMSIKHGEVYERFFDYLSLHVVSMAAALFVLVKELAPQSGTAVTKFLDFIRKDLFGVYLIHPFWLGVVNTVSFRQGFSELITLPLITIIVFLLSLFTSKLIRLIPGLRKVVE